MKSLSSRSPEEFWKDSLVTEATPESLSLPGILLLVGRNKKDFGLYFGIMVADANGLGFFWVCSIPAM